ncbi:taste receptor type 1 member 2 [Latimeria chalumnae]|uniref:taste receptor type 1 member 2 n=1 Tax=Latimeria chalumnae TaxID=7897 RepID=UPI0003C16D8D|nr:PREDICTED: taste receptor type 1 member 2 [Latimeria chalumnae]|eukprot:XP_005986178.1 PREDICTED: taste receptor type 1 member 2 [Latimeria chalumnae]
MPYVAFFSLCCFIRLMGTTLPHVPTKFQLPGDYVLGGLVTVHANSTGGTPVSRLKIFNCEECTPISVVFFFCFPNSNSLQIYYPGYRFLQGLRYAVEEINNSSILLPDVLLGYEIFDTCFGDAINPILHFLTTNKSRWVEVKDSSVEYQPKVIAVIGPDSSSTALISAEILSSFLIPQISYYVTAQGLNDITRYPSFFRLIPSAQYQIQAIILLLKEFGWKWIAVISSDDDYGIQAAESLADAISKEEICIAYSEVIPLVQEESKPTNSLKAKLAEIVDGIVKSQANLIIVFSFDAFLSPFFEEVVAKNVTGKVWLASEYWAVSESVSSVSNIKSIGTVLGTAVRHIEMPGYVDYILKETEEHSELRAMVKEQESPKDTCNQDCTKCYSVTTQQLLNPPERRITFTIYAAVYSVAHALHNLLGCESGTCKKLKVYPWQVLQKMKRVNFSLLGNPIYFDEDGNPPTGFDIVFWDWSKGDVSFKKVGIYSPNSDHIINRDLVYWNAPENKVPVSVCSEECAPGHWKKLSETRSCCFSCIKCEKDTFLNKSDLTTCQKCDFTQWSPIGSEVCYDRHIEYLDWPDASAIVLLSVTAVGLMVTVAVMLIFVLNFQTPVVKSAGRIMCFIMLLNLAFAYCSMTTFVGKPTTATCIFRKSVFSIILVTCFSCLTVRSFQIICIFKMAAKLPKAYDYWVKYHGQYITVFIIVLVKIVITFAWIATDPPGYIPYKTYDQHLVLLECSTPSPTGTAMNMAIDFSSSIFCFIFAYIGKELPQNYNEAKCITFSVMIYYISWIAYVTIAAVYYGDLIITIEYVASLASLLGITIGYFVPKCYVVVFRPDHNTTAYFQTTIHCYTNRRSDRSH